MKVEIKFFTFYRLQRVRDNCCLKGNLADLKFMVSTLFLFVIISGVSWWQLGKIEECSHGRFKDSICSFLILLSIQNDIVICSKLLYGKTW